MDGLLRDLGILEILGGAAGLIAVALARWHGTTWPPLYLWASAFFYLVAISAGYRLHQRLPGGRALSTIVQLAQLKVWSAAAHAVHLLAGPAVLLEWSRGSLEVSVGAGGLVGVTPAPAMASVPPPSFAWLVTLVEAESDLLSRGTFNAVACAGFALLFVALVKRERRPLAG